MSKIKRPPTLAMKKKINVRGEALPRYVNDTSQALYNLVRDLGDETAVAKDYKDSNGTVVVRALGNSHKTKV